jgi:putative mycofactocin binding protein MftB
VESTDKDAAEARRGATPTEAGLSAEWGVPDWVRVRRESFGLLFYDTRSTMLTYVRSGDKLVPPGFTGPGRVLRLSDPSARTHPAMERLLKNLAAKGLIVAAPAE